MFTGIIEFLGTVQHVDAVNTSRDLVITAPSLLDGTRVGDSIAVNGVCLTVVDCDRSALRFQAGPETLARTNLGDLRTGDRVNLERPLRLSDRLGGHLVQGHVDGIGWIAERVEQGGTGPDRWELVWFRCCAELTALMVPKGSVAVDGVSLTLVDVADTRFSVALIPHTLDHTTFGFKTVGAAVNIETDILAKYVAKLLRGGGSPLSGAGASAP
jgi:riboflavin synthase